MAVTLADLASRGGVEKIQTAEALSNAILQFYESVIERPVRAMLASFTSGKAFAWQGYDEASWVIKHLTDKASLIAPPLLHFIPQLAIPKLLTEAFGDNRALHSNPYHPLRLLQDWVKGAHPSTPEPISRRKEVLRGTKKWLEAGNDSIAGYKAMLFAMIPHYEDMIPMPGSGNASLWQEAFLTEAGPAQFAALLEGKS